MLRYSIVFVILILTSCSSPEQVEIKTPKLFLQLSSGETGINFENALTTREDFDVFRYRNFYNGGGVGIGDFNNDGLADVFLTSNMGDNKLYLNKGDWKFQDITDKAGVMGSKVWSTGVSIADVNGDGFLDIYVSNAGDVGGGRRENELFINNGNLTFTDRAKEYGLADRGFSTHAVFFDFDKDGDLDCYVLNNSYRPVSTLGYRNLRHERDEFGGHKLYRNDNNRFVDISESAGIYGSVIGFGLGVTVGDVNQDSWPDLYISNDFYEMDYLYINNKDGTYTESLEKYMGHISMFSMGADMADLNNDGYPEIFSTDMLPEDDYRLKTLVAFETYDVYQLRLKNGYHHQFMRNMLHLNNKDGTFSEIGELAGVAATDWSWGALMVDLDNDRFKEIFVCNGIYKDLINQDFVEYLGSSDQMKAAIEGKKVDFKLFVDKMPSVPISNYVFTRKNDLQYENVAAAWGLDEKGFSNGAAYGDLDNDGDLDLVVNNVNKQASVYRNQTRETKQNHSLTIRFEGIGKNIFGLGATVQAFVGDEILSFDHMPIRGFQSSMDYRMVIGLGGHSLIDSLVVSWPDQKVQVMTDVKADQVITLRNADARLVQVIEEPPHRHFRPFKTDSIKHIENVYNDFDRDRLQYHMLSTQGPAFAKADLNNDGLEDIFLGGAVGESGAIFMQKPGFRFSKITDKLFESDKESEDVAAAFFDADGDDDLDLYVVTGGSEHKTQSLHTIDRLYINEGIRGGEPAFSKSTGKIPTLYHSGSCVKPTDIDNDGDLDLFVGTRSMPSYYGSPVDQVLLINDGNGIFHDATVSYAPELKQLGMVTDAVWFDHDNNGYQDLLVVGDWMPVTLFLNSGTSLSKAAGISGLENTEGWWNRIERFDADGDGDSDFILGNIGLNSRFKPSQTSPISLYLNDFDQNGSAEPIFAYLKDGDEYPLALRQDIVGQMSSLKKKFVFYKDYADKTLAEVFDPKLLKQATRLTFRESRSSLLISNGNSFELRPLPLLAQTSPVYGIQAIDIDNDNDQDIILAGNLFAVKPEIGRYDALHGLVLKNDGKGAFSPLSNSESGLNVQGETRHVAVFNSKVGRTIAFVRNNDAIAFYQLLK